MMLPYSIIPPFLRSCLECPSVRPWSWPRSRSNRARTTITTARENNLVVFTVPHYNAIDLAQVPRVQVPAEGLFVNLESLTVWTEGEAAHERCIECLIPSG